MTATFLPQIHDRATEIKSGNLSGIELQKQIKQFDDDLKELKDKDAKLPKDQARTDYIKTISEALDKFKSTKPEKEEEFNTKVEKEEKPEAKPFVESKKEPEKLVPAKSAKNLEPSDSPSEPKKEEV